MTDETHWIVLAKPSGDILHADYITAGAHPRFAGLAWDAASMECHKTSGTYDPAISSIDRASWAWVEDAAKVEALLIPMVKAEAERRRMLVLSSGGSKKTVYALKQAEVEAWNALVTPIMTALAAFLTLPLVTQRRRFRFAMAEAARRGEANPSAAIARFAAGADAANAEAARIEAIEQSAVTAIKAAATVSAKRAAYAAINWSWTL